LSTTIAVVEKAFQVLEAMSDLGRAATLKELSEVSGLPKPTLHRILQTLVELNYVEQDNARSRYSLTLKLFRLGRGDSYEDVKERALPLMEGLHRRFDETINLGVLQGSHIYYLHFIETTQNLRWQVRPGARDPFYCTALGRAIVAHLPEPRQDQLVERAVIEQRTPFTPSNKTELRKLLSETAARGWAHDNEENDLGVVCFGIPLLDGDRPLASISISLPKSRLTAKRQAEIVAALMEARDGKANGRTRRKSAA
jgi:DNA-binding IclR family transcriptional regulator